MILTPSQNKAIEWQKKFFSSLYPDADYDICTRRRTNELILRCTYSFKNMLGTQTLAGRAWEIGKRGKITTLENR